MQRTLSPVKPHPRVLVEWALTGLLQEGPLFAIYRSMTDGPEKAGAGVMLYSPCLAQVQSPAEQIGGRAAVKQSRLTPDPLVGRGQLSPCPGLNTATTGICGRMCLHKSRPLGQISHRWTPRSF